MRINLAWKNLKANPRRTAVALLGVGFAVMLLFMQIGFLWSMRAGTTTFYDAFEADLIITSSDYINLRLTEPFDRTRLAQAATVPGVARVGATNLGFTEWEDPATEQTLTCVVVGLPGDPALLTNPALREAFPALAAGRQVIVDNISSALARSITTGASAKIAGRDVSVAGEYRMGLALYAKVAVAASAETFELLTRIPGRSVQFGLVQLAPEADVTAIAAALRELLPDDVLIFRRSELIEAEQTFYMEEKPVGIVFRAGTLIAFVVGSVIFFQILSTEIANKLKEFATLRALGFRDSYVYRVGVQQAILYAICGYLPCALAMAGVFHVMTGAAKMDLGMTLPLLGTVLGLTLAMCGISGWLALRRVRQADPADLF
jgi:putative ABC transport system permease protein